MKYMTFEFFIIIGKMIQTDIMFLKPLKPHCWELTNQLQWVRQQNTHIVRSLIRLKNNKHTKHMPCNLGPLQSLNVKFEYQDALSYKNYLMRIFFLCNDLLKLWDWNDLWGRWAGNIFYVFTAHNCTGRIFM